MKILAGEHIVMSCGCVVKPTVTVGPVWVYPQSISINECRQLKLDEWWIELLSICTSNMCIIRGMSSVGRMYRLHEKAFAGSRVASLSTALDRIEED